MRAGGGNYRDLVEKANSIILRMDTHGIITFEPFAKPLN
jgi:hypothetical protein